MTTDQVLAFENKNCWDCHFPLRPAKGILNAADETSFNDRLYRSQYAKNVYFWKILPITNRSSHVLVFFLTILEPNRLSVVRVDYRLAGMVLSSSPLSHASYG